MGVGMMLIIFLPRTSREAAVRTKVKTLGQTAGGTVATQQAASIDGACTIVTEDIARCSTGEFLLSVAAD